MGLSGGSKSTSESGSAQKWAKPIAQNAANMGTNLFNQYQPMVGELTSGISGMVPGLNQSFTDNQARIQGNAGALNNMVGGLTDAFGQNYANMQNVGGMVNSAMNTAMSAYGGPNMASAALPLALRNMYSGTNPGLRSAQGYTNAVLGGAFLDGNPYLDAALSRTNRDVTNNVNSQFSAAGRYGSGAHTDVLSRNLADSQNAARMADYNNQMSRMDQAAQTAGSLSQTEVANNTGNINNLLNAANTQSGINNQSFNQAMTAAGLQPSLAQASYFGLNPLLATTGAVADQGNAAYSALPNVLNASTTAAQLPMSMYAQYANGLGNLFNGGTQTTTQSGGIGGLLGGIGSIMSGFGAIKGAK